MRVAFPASRYLDPATPRSWSGLPYFMRRALEGVGIETKVISLAETDRIGRCVRFLYWRLARGRRYLRFCETRQLRHYATQIEHRLPFLDVDAVFGSSTWFCAYLRTQLPIFFWTDACFAGLVDYYPSYTRLAAPSLRAGHAAEQGALDRCSRAFYSSEWAARTAALHYRVRPEKLSIVPFGGNVQEPPSSDEINDAIDGRGATPCRLLLVGVEWHRKGASIAVEAVEVLRARGVDARLTIVGCGPPRGATLPESVELVPYISKETADGRRRLGEFFKRSHFFIMPTRAEAYGLVFSEAGLNGVPSLATDVGGLSSVITNDVNGRLFDLSARGDQYADYVCELMRDPDRYNAMARQSAAEARARLSWDYAARKIAEILEEAVNQGSSAFAKAGQANNPRQA